MTDISEAAKAKAVELATAFGSGSACYAERELERFAWGWLDTRYTDYTGGRHANDRDYSADEMVDAFIEGHAQARIDAVLTDYRSVK